MDLKKVNRKKIQKLQLLRRVASQQQERWWATILRKTDEGGRSTNYELVP